MICRGVLLDIPALTGVEHLEVAYGITDEYLEQALENTKSTEVDVALIRTGWFKLYHNERISLEEFKRRGFAPFPLLKVSA